MTGTRKKAATVQERAHEAAQNLAALAAEAAEPGLRARLAAAFRALQSEPAGGWNTALLENPAEARALIRDVVAEELSRYWERRFGGRP